MTAYRMISAEKATGFPVSVACRLLEVSRSAYYDWERGAPSDRELSDAWPLDASRRSTPRTEASMAGGAACPLATALAAPLDELEKSTL